MVQGLLVAALLCGAFVVVSEIPFWGSRSGLWSVLTALGIGVIALAAAQLIGRREKPPSGLGTRRPEAE